MTAEVAPRSLDRRHFDVMKDGAIIANSGHFNVEINIKAHEAMSESKRNVRRTLSRMHKLGLM